MPSSSKKQASMMSAVAHGMKGSGVPVKVAKGFLKADEASGKYEKSRHAHSRAAWQSGTPLKRADGGAVKSYSDSSTYQPPNPTYHSRPVGPSPIPIDRPSRGAVPEHEQAQAHADNTIQRLRAALSDAPFLHQIKDTIINKNAKDYIAGGGDKANAYDSPSMPSPSKPPGE